jgi:hypothetical protein
LKDRRPWEALSSAARKGGNEAKTNQWNTENVNILSVTGLLAQQATGSIYNP